MSQDKRGIGLALLGAFLGAAFLLPYKAASENGGAAAATAGLVFVSAILNGAVSLFHRPDRAGLSNEWHPLVPAALSLALLTAVGNYCSSQALSLMDPTVASVLYRTQILFVALGGVLFLKESLSGPFVLGAAITLVGLCVMSAPFRVENLTGSAWAIGSAMSFASMQLVVRRIAHQVPLITLNALRLILAALLLCLIPNVVVEILKMDAAWYWNMLLAAALGPVASRLCIMFSLRDITAAHASLLSLATPVFSFLLAYIWLGTLPTPLEALGGGMVLVGIVSPILSTLHRISSPDTVGQIKG